MQWIDALAECKRTQTDFVLISILRVDGSAPRNTDAKMVVTGSEQFDTIGGGKLEYEAIAHARALLDGSAQTRRKIFHLGARFEQCCGGRVELLFDCVKTPEIWVFGAGHIAEQMAPILATLPLRARFLDNRQSFCQWEIAGLTPEHYTDPSDVLTAPPTAAQIVVMTHDHQLDMRITACALKHPNVQVYVVGSDSKAAKFKSQLKAHGIDHSRLTCPIGEKTLNHPAAVALSICHTLLCDQQTRPLDMPVKVPEIDDTLCNGCTRCHEAITTDTS